MDSRPPTEREDENELVFQDLMPEKPANAFQKRIIDIQQNWPPRWNKRRLLLLSLVLSSLLIFFLVFEVMQPFRQQNGTIHEVTISQAIGTTYAWQVYPYENVLYFIETQRPNNSGAGIASGTLEAVNAHTGAFIWSYEPYHTAAIALFKNILYVQTNTNLIALNATNRSQLWEKQTLHSDAAYLHLEQGILLTLSTQGRLEALNASTGAQLWQFKQQEDLWMFGNGIFYTTPNSTHLGLSALDAKSGKQLWYNPNVYQVIALDNDIFYLQNDATQKIQAFDGRNDKLLWQLNTQGKKFTLSANHGFLFLSDAVETNVEVLNGRTGKLLWQRQGSLNTLVESPDRTVISSAQTNVTEIVRTTDGTTLYRLPRSDTLLALENQSAIFTSDPINNPQNVSDNIITHIQAVQLKDGKTIWNHVLTGTIWLLPNNTLVLAPVNSNALVMLRADDGQTLWEHTFDSSGH